MTSATVDRDLEGKVALVTGARQHVSQLTLGSGPRAAPAASEVAAVDDHGSPLCRQIDTAVMRLLAAIRTVVPQQDSLTTVKARRAANTRWEMERQRNAAG